MGDDESKFRDAVRGLVKVQQINVETGEQRTPRDRLLEMIGGGEGDVATLRAENTQLKTELTVNQQELAVNQQELTAKDEEIAVNQKELADKDKELTAKDEEIAALEAQLQKLQQPKEGVPPV